jgi:micrococcal nuclease
MRKYALIGFVCLYSCFTACARPPESLPFDHTEEIEPTPSALPSTPTPQYPCLPIHARRDDAQLVKVLSGDAVLASIHGASFEIRYLGVAAPDPKSDPSGAERAAIQNRALVEGRLLLLLRDVSEVDSAGRLMRYVMADGVFINEELLRLGVARAAPAEPDGSCRIEFEAAEQAARTARVGVWQYAAADLTKTALAACTGLCLTPSPGCRIKGNINSKGEKIYHLPGARDYDRTVIEPAKGERWFCTEAEANAAGWRGGKS